MCWCTNIWQDIQFDTYFLIININMQLLVWHILQELYQNVHVINYLSNRRDILDTVITPLIFKIQ